MWLCGYDFVARQLIENTKEHSESMYMLVVDLKKEYDSVLRQAL